MTTRNKYAAVANRTGGWWTVDVPAVRHATQARRLDQTEHMVRDMVALLEDVPADSFDVEIGVETDSLPTALNEVKQARAAQATVVAVIELRDRGLPMRDFGSLLGMTHQRVSQLVAAEAKAKRET